jgi:flavin prenyltransferase
VKQRLVVAITGASGALLAERIVEKSKFPVILAAGKWGRQVYETECGPFETLAKKAVEVYDDDDMFAPIASGSVDTAGMVAAPCSAGTLGRIASGTSPNLICRAAHCHLKEQKKLILCLRESPLTLIDLQNAAAVAAAGAVVMPLSFPFYMTKGRDPRTVSLVELMDVFADRVLKLLGHPPEATWETVRQ